MAGFPRSVSVSSDDRCSYFVLTESSHSRRRLKGIFPRGARRSGDDVRGNLIFNEGDAITQLQFALFQPL